MSRVNPKVKTEKGKCSKISVRSTVYKGPCDLAVYLEQVANAVVKGVMRPDRKLKGFLRVKPK